MSNLQDLFDCATSNQGFWTHNSETRAKIAEACRNRSPETRAKLAQSGLKNIGSKRTDETRAKMSALRLGAVMPEETRSKISAALKGKTAHNKGVPVSDEVRAKMSANNVHSKPVMTPIGEFPSLSKAAQAYNTGGATMSYWIKVSKTQEFYYTQK